MQPLLTAALLILCATSALGWSEPAKGSAERSGMLDATRPHAEWLLGPPVEFVVDQMRVQGNVGFAVLLAQRPGGAPIDLAQSPVVRRDGRDPQTIDGTRIDALYRREGKTWVAVHWRMGATDLWYADPAYCADFAVVLAEYCQ